MSEPENYLRLMQTFSLECDAKYQFDFGREEDNPVVNSLCGTPDGKVYVGGTNKKVIRFYPDKSKPNEVFCEGKNELKQLLSDEKGRIVSVWEDGTVRIKSDNLDKVLDIKAQGTTAKMLTINPQKTDIFFLDKDDPKVIRKVEVATQAAAKYSLKEGEGIVQLAANQDNELFVLDKKGTVQKVNLDTGEVELFPAPESTLY